MRSADYPAEEAWAGRAGEARIGCGIQAIDYRERIFAHFGRRSVEQGLQLGGADRRPWRTIGDPVAKVARVLDGAGEECPMRRQVRRIGGGRLKHRRSEE